MWTAKPHQIAGAKECYAILAEYGLVYIAWEERTGKTITSIILSEKCPTVRRVLVVTKKKALPGWQDALTNFKHDKIYTLTNYHQLGKIKGEFDLIILDEAHSYISGFPQRKTFWKAAREHTKDKPIIYLSATPHAQGYGLLVNQFALSDYGPWRQFKSFYDWFKEYADRVNGQLPLTRISAVQTAIDYKKVQDERIKKEVAHLFSTRTRKELGFKHEPKDVLHYVQLTDKTKNIYNTIVKDKLIDFTLASTGEDYLLVCDTPMKMRWALHMLEGGVLKIDDKPVDLGNSEKIDYIKQTWGDSKTLVIMHQYKPDAIKLNKAFKHATILQATTYAEGVDLSNYEDLVIYSQNFSTAQHTQRRARQANMDRQSEINVHYLLVKGGVSEQIYKSVSVNKKNYVDTRFEPIGD